MYTAEWNGNLVRTYQASAGKLRPNLPHQRVYGGDGHKSDHDCVSRSLMSAHPQSVFSKAVSAGARMRE
jgi:hypothetical protein